MRKNFYKTVLPAALIAALMSSGCGKSNSDSASNQTTIASDSQTVTAADGNEEEEKVSTVEVAEYEDSDFDEDYDESSATIITLADTITVSGDNASVKDNIVTITAGGTYIITGTGNGQIVVDSEDKEIVRLVMKNATLTSDSDSPIYIAQAKKTIVTLAAGTTNQITDTASHEESTDENAINTDAAIYSKDSITINGSGSLTINCTNANGLTSKDHLVIANGTLNITAGNNGLKGKDYVLINNGDITIDSANDGIKSTNTKDTSLGYISIDGGNITINSDGDCIQAETDLYINGGTFTLTSADGNYEVKSGSDMPGGGMIGGGQRPDNMQAPGNNTQTPDSTAQAHADGNSTNSNEQNNNSAQPPELPSNSSDSSVTMPDTANPKTPDSVTSDTSNTTNEGTSNSSNSSTDSSDTTTEDESTSQKGLKASCNIVISGGTLNINTADDAIHSNQTITYNNATSTIATGDDGIHADNTLTINNGTINITKCYEGLEAYEITINDGDIDIVANDDGINASDSSVSTTSTEPQMGMGGMDNGTAVLNIKGGNIYVNASGDGLDANGYIYQSGGYVIVDGPTSDGDGALDYDQTYEITGGVLMTAGSSGMAQNVSDSSTQGSVIVYLSERYDGGKKVSLTDDSGNELLSFTPAKSFNCIQFSSSDIVTGGTYKILIDGTEVESFTADTTVSTAGTATNTMSGGQGGPGGQMPSGGAPSGEMPSGGAPSGEMPSGGTPSGNNNNNSNNTGNTNNSNNTSNSSNTGNTNSNSSGKNNKKAKNSDNSGSGTNTSETAGDSI